MRHIKALCIILFLLLVVVVVAENIPNLKIPVVFGIDLWFFKYQTPDIPLGFVAVIAFFIGVISMGLFGIVERFQLKKQVKILQGKVNERERKLNSLRCMDVTNEVVNSDQTFDT